MLTLQYKSETKFGFCSALDGWHNKTLNRYHSSAGLLRTLLRSLQYIVLFLWLHNNNCLQGGHFCVVALGLCEYKQTDTVQQVIQYSDSVSYSVLLHLIGSRKSTYCIRPTYSLLLYTPTIYRPVSNMWHTTKTQKICASRTEILLRAHLIF